MEQRPEGVRSPFSSPEDELAYLREEVRRKEEELGDRSAETRRENVLREEVRRYAQASPHDVLAGERVLPEGDVEELALGLSPERHDTQINELLSFVEEKGLKNTLAIVQKLDNPHLEDDFHRALVQYLEQGRADARIKKRSPLWRSLTMSLYELSFPAGSSEGTERPFKELVSAMEQLYAGLLSIVDEKSPTANYFTLEIALPHAGAQTSFYAAVPNDKRDLFEKHVRSVFPNAVVSLRRDDYNIFNENGAHAAATFTLAKNSALPLKTYEHFDHDPLSFVLNAFSKLENEGEGAAFQLVFHPAAKSREKEFADVLEKLRKGAPAREALYEPSVVETAFKTIFDMFASEKKENGEEKKEFVRDDVAIGEVEAKTSSPLVAVNVRVVASAQTLARARALVSEIASATNQFENARGNKLKTVYQSRAGAEKTIRRFLYREFSKREALLLNMREVTTLFHFPAEGGRALATPHVKEASMLSAPAPFETGSDGIYLGTNSHQGAEREVFFAPEGRTRHFYVIGQTGTGKSAFLRTMISQDIERGEGVCFIDPHGSDVQEILAAIPSERYEDLIYFDPAYTPRPLGLNMLEYDPRFPEQKTFVVNELFGIFKKLYGANPESMGPMFEQYFRNATLLVVEDPSSGNTLLDVSRVMADARFRELKLSRCANPVVVQFWREIATKAGGEASLQNIVPYITSKFDVFLANEIMRPIIAQEHSSFNFRNVMDTRKILLVNLSKGRLGDTNAHLIGLILVGKILMAALSRADSFGTERPPFYLYLDEFQNVTTSSISVILSEARKYGLGLTLAHQFIAQLEDQIRDAVFGNVGSLAAFRVGAEDAEFLERQFAPTLKAHHLMSVENYHAYLRLLVNGRPTKPFNVQTPAPREGDRANIARLQEYSHLTYGRPRAEIEAEIQRRYRA